VGAAWAALGRMHMKRILKVVAIAASALFLLTASPLVAKPLPAIPAAQPAKGKKSKAKKAKKSRKNTHATNGKTKHK
jgi:hypothetical protein